MGNVNAGRVRIFKINTFKALTKEENDIYKDVTKKRIDLDTKISENTDIRKVDSKLLYQTDKNQVSIFEGDIVRLALSDRGQTKADNQLIDDIITMKIYHNEIMWQIISNGIMIADKKYIFYSATTGQVRNTTITLIKESFFDKHKSELLVGLYKDDINNLGGMNAGKYLAYTALSLSSSVLPEHEINIDRCIVVNGFESFVNDFVKYIDIQQDDEGELYVKDTPKDYIKKDINIEHTDGAGMFLPHELPSSCQIRSGYFKGAMFPFDFKAFATQIAHNTIITDAWGKRVDIIKEDIRYIFTASQLKMWKFYESWNVYKKTFKDNNLKISINSYANPAKDEVTFAYQYLQTLPYGIDIKRLCDPTKNKIFGLHKSIETVKEVMGYTTDIDTELEENNIEAEDVKDNDCESENKSTTNDIIAKAITIYPNIANDSYITDKIHAVTKAYRKRAKAGKIELPGYYSYVAPDMYAFCEFLFCGIKEPNGLVPKNHVYNKYYDVKGNIKQIICLRSPHLSRYEYGKRNLIKSDECRKWFKYMESDTIVSCHDLISKNLQCDWDGDEILVTPDEYLYSIVPDLPPLYYNMQKASAQPITDEAIYNTLVKGFDNNVIGDVSNIITKLWNSPNINEENQSMYDDVINVFCAYSNYSIDYPKTGKNIKLGKYQDEYDRLAPSKVGFEKPSVLFPNFFIEAKNKKVSSCYDMTDSVMDRIKAYISKGTGRLSYKYLDKDKGFDYRMLMDNHKDGDKAKYEVNRYDKKYETLYLTLKTLKHQKKSLTKNLQDNLKRKNIDTIEIKNKYELFHYQCISKIKEIFTFNQSFNERQAVNYFIDLEYRQTEFVTSSKDILWKCFGHIILQNLKDNCNSGINIKAKPRMSYIKAINGDKKNDEAISTLMEKRSVAITDDEYNFIINSIPKQKNGKLYKNDKEFLFVIYTLYKEAKEHSRLKNGCLYITKRKHVKTDGKKKKTYFNFNTLMNLANIKSCASSLKRISEIDSVEIVDNSDKKYVTIKITVPDTKSKTLFTVDNIFSPMVYLNAYESNKPICQCVMCGSDFIKTSPNQKTCSDRCKEELHRWSQIKINENNRNKKDIA